MTIITSLRRGEHARNAAGNELTSHSSAHPFWVKLDAIICATESSDNDCKVIAPEMKTSAHTSAGRAINWNKQI